MDDERPIAWPALEEGTPVYDSSGEDLGTITAVVADEAKDIFSGIAFKSGLWSKERFAPADLVEEITPTSVRLSIPAADAEALADYEA